MRVISYSYVREFIKKHPDSSIALRSWYRKMKRKRAVSIHELKRAFPGVDYIGNKRFVFNIKGNKYRVVALILFGPQKAFIRYIGTHADYDKTNCQEI
ncbi:MAG: type II toxin-antitoxin system HigB family toxin [Bacteroidota bacterium]